jgi:hypothetical protein
MSWSSSRFGAHFVGGCAFDSKQTDMVQRALDVLGHRIVGTYHSRPLSAPGRQALIWRTPLKET